MTDDLAVSGLHLRAMSTAKRSADFIASSEAIDSYGEIVEQSWDLSRFKSNPVILYAHNSRELPIGTCTRIEVVGGKLECTIALLSADANPKAEQVWQCMQAGALRAVSVGFVPGSVRFEKHNDKDVYILSNNQLHEISVVPIPANPEALAKMRARAVRSGDDVDHTRQKASVFSVPAPATSRRTVTVNGERYELDAETAALMDQRAAIMTAHLAQGRAEVEALTPKAMPHTTGGHELAATFQAYADAGTMPAKGAPAITNHFGGTVGGLDLGALVAESFDLEVA